MTHSFEKDESLLVQWNNPDHGPWASPLRRLGLADVLDTGAEIDVRAAVSNKRGNRRKRLLLERHVAGMAAARRRDRQRTLEHGPDRPAILFESRRLGIDAIPAILLADLYSLWLSRCGPRSLPSYEDLDPLGLSWAVSRIALVQVGSWPATFQVAIDASKQIEARGQDLTGGRIGDLRPAGLARLLEAHYREAVEDGAPSLRSIAVSRDVTEIACTSLALPLSNTGTQIDMLLTCLVGAEPLWALMAEGALTSDEAATPDAR